MGPSKRATCENAARDPVSEPPGHSTPSPGSTDRPEQVEAFRSRPLHRVGFPLRVGHPAIRPFLWGDARSAPEARAYRTACAGDMCSPADHARSSSMDHEFACLLQVAAHLCSDAKDVQRIGPARVIIASLDCLQRLLAQHPPPLQVLVQGLSSWAAWLANASTAWASRSSMVHASCVVGWAHGGTPHTSSAMRAAARAAPSRSTGR